MSALMKFCNTCSTDKKVEEFYKNARKSDCLDSKCKACIKAHRELPENIFKHMVTMSKMADRRACRSSEIEYINVQHIKDMIVIQNGKCRYCECKMVYGAGVNRTTNRDALTLERVDNVLPHVVENCVLACKGCNDTRGNNHTYEYMITHGVALKAQKIKFCPYCETTLPITAFGVDNSQSKGVRSICKACHTKREQERNIYKRQRVA